VETISPDDLKRFFPGASPSTLRRNQAVAQRSSSPQPEPITRNPLAGKARREAKGSTGATVRYRVKFTVYATRPMDWDNIACKELQDCLVIAALIPDDNWQVLEGVIVSKKARTREEEGTEIIIERIQ